MTPLQLIIQREYLQDVKSRSFWAGTLLLPVLMIVFGAVMGFLMEDSDTLRLVGSMGQEHEKLSGIQLLGLMTGIFLSMFLVIYGTMIFNKVKAEKTSRIMEMIATTVSGRTMMLGKIIAVALIGITQMLVWILLIGAGFAILLPMLGIGNILSAFVDSRLLLAMLYAILYFAGGYLLYGSLYAMVGAMTDRENENQGYLVIITYILLGSLYITSFAIDNPESSLAVWCSYIPFTSPGTGVLEAISGAFNIWETLLSLFILYAAAYSAVIVAGKVYTSAMLLNGTKFSLKDIMTFIKAK